MNRTLALPALLGLMMMCPRGWAALVVEVTHGQDDAIPIAIVPFNSPLEASASFDVAQCLAMPKVGSSPCSGSARWPVL